jgi:response regulator of citrate/malate metabolism
MSQKPRPLNREGFMSRVVMQQVELDENSIVCIRALPASVIVEGSDDKHSFEPAKMLVHSLCDENGTLLFSNEETAQAMTIDHVALKKILEAIVDLNGLKKTNDGEAGEPEKN